MGISISDHLGVDFDAFEDSGAFNAILDVDSRFHVDPLLVRTSDAPELADAATVIDTFFNDILVLLSASAAPNDRLWRAAFERFDFREIQGTCIGYAARSTRGSGFGPHLRSQILTTANEIVDAGLSDPRIFELVGILEPGIGADRISDMLVTILEPQLKSYTRRILGELGLAQSDVANLLVNPYSGSKVMLLPKDILSPLPVALSFDDIDAVCQYNSKLREQVNLMLGRVVRYSVGAKKRTLRRRLFSNRQALADFLEEYKRGMRPRYDFNRDPIGEVFWYREAKRVAEHYPLLLGSSKPTSLDEVQETVDTMCNHFKRLVEDNGLWNLLYNDDGTHRHENSVQKLFYGIADAYCRANDTDISPEVNSGRGPVDFKLSKGQVARVLVETKLTTNSRLLHGFHTQLEEYKKAEGTTHGKYLVIHVEGGTLAQSRQVEARCQGANAMSYLFVDARKRQAASRHMAATLLDL